MSHIAFFMHIFAFLLLALLQVPLAFAFTLSTPPTWEQLTFNYAQVESQQALNILKQLPKPPHTITSDQLSQLTKEVSYIIDAKKLKGIDAVVLPAYLANAQKDFAWLSYLLTGEFRGSLGPVTLWTLQLFIPEATLPSLTSKEFDLFTSSVAAFVVQKYASRLQGERKGLFDYPIREEEGLWKPTEPGYIGLNYGSAKTWVLTSSKEYVAKGPPPSNSLFWKDQIAQIKEEQQHLDGKKVQAVFGWAGLTSPDAGSFEKFLYTYLDQKHLPLADQLYIRSLYLSALADSTVACFHSKYTFWVMRPGQRDEGVRPLIVTPNHPSYPSAHSTNSATACTILSFLFPEDGEKWDQMADEAGMSRIWGGIHYPIDHQAGQELGKRIGVAALQRAKVDPAATP